MQKKSIGAQIVGLLLFLAFMVVLLDGINADSTQSQHWRNNIYFANEAKEILLNIPSGMSQVEVDGILNEYESIAFFEVDGASVYGEESEISSFYDVSLQGDPTNSGLMTTCKIYIAFEEDSTETKKVLYISDDIQPDSCGRKAEVPYGF